MTTANGDAAATPATDPQAQLDALFRGPRERFTAERNALAKRLAAAGDAPAAARVKALSKPNVSAWAVNQLWWTRQSDVEALLEAGRRQARALHGGAGPSEQATAGQARRRALDTLATAAESILQQAGHAAGPATLRRISTTLEALAAHGLRPDGPHPGRLSADLDPPGFDLLAALAAADPPPPEPSAPPPNPTAPTPDPAADEARAEAEAVLATALRARETARDDSEHAARCLDRSSPATTRHCWPLVLRPMRSRWPRGAWPRLDAPWNPPS
ncbi:MAG: hypothetical protein K0V04_41695 [Deltaproteobacteria bacterium]|nr:hypothetical protein [Deltaproteobacteria bacterium]